MSICKTPSITTSSFLPYNVSWFHWILFTSVHKGWSKPATAVSLRFKKFARDSIRKLMRYLTRFSPVSHFYTPWKRQKTKVFWRFQRVKKCGTGLKWVSLLQWFSFSGFFCFSVNQQIFTYSNSTKKNRGRRCENNRTMTVTLLTLDMFRTFL